ncbi:MAG: hypothetical protein A2X86_09970 [Bdellovibrionales bacterium GWA2_49_15]|nr:MAG: hypothetical protein A2X86_09970 [Bdellovibrionales bacterium GWA2_49_15]HAZ13110.1 hypothetical protein [Bdellovibrionales bacterium]
MDILLKQFESVFGGQGSSYYWYIGVIVVLFTIALIIIVFKSKSHDFTGEIEQLRLISESRKEMLEQHLQREKELESKIADYEARLARLEQKR